MSKLKSNQKKELVAAFERCFDHEQKKTIKSFLFNRDSLVFDAWACFQSRKDFSFDLNGDVLTIPFSKVPPSLVMSSGSVKSSADVNDSPKRKGRGPGKKPVKQVVSFALEPELMQELTKRAERDERAVSSLIRLAIKHYLECVK